MFGNVFKNKRVLITGNTGFKGSWLTTWLLGLGAKIYGFSIDVPTNPSIFETAKLADRIDHTFGDIRDLKAFEDCFEKAQPDFVFHLAAQPIVSVSYKDPLGTISTNVMGTSNVLETLRKADRDIVAVIITSDKCYENVEWVWGYKESDHLGGKDLYSGSKGAAEIIFHSYFCSFFQDSKVKLATGRAGNVIGGGDWALDRIIPDAIRAWNQGESVEIRSPKATRPWQHVLEPLSGYLNLAQGLFEGLEISGESYNFGPRSDQNATVSELLEDLSSPWGFEKVEQAYQVTGNVPFKEAGLLKLNCDKALFDLKWLPNLDYPTLIQMVGDWYYQYYKENADAFDLTRSQIQAYQDFATKHRIKWALDE